MQQAIVETLVAQDAARAGANRVRRAGGGRRRRREPQLRERLAEAAARQGAQVFYPRIEFCTDNAAMIAVAGMARLKAAEHESPAIRARATWSLSELEPLAGDRNS